MTDRELHELAHEFSDWIDTRLTKWEPQDKPFNSFKDWVRVSFMQWANLTGLPRKHWKRVLREYMND